MDASKQFKKYIKKLIFNKNKKLIILETRAPRR